MQRYRQRRGRNACTWCHQQRVRCDVSRAGPPCTRCAQDGEKCEIWRKDFDKAKPKTKARKHRTNSIETLHSNNSNTSAGLWEREGKLQPGHVGFSQYSFLQLSPSSNLGAEDMKYLSSKGCFDIPLRPALDKFVYMYFMHVHPSSPVIDEADLWSLYSQHHLKDDDDPGAISLFVFQAMLFVSCPYVELDTVKQCGFPSKVAARNEFYRRAKLLLDLDAEDRPIEKARGALLLSYQASSDNPRVGSVMLGVAIQNLVIAEKAVSEPDENSKSPSIKRIWWSIVLRDGLLSIAFRRSTQLMWSDPNLKLDFLNENDLEDEILHSKVHGKRAKLFLLDLFKKQCQLAVIVIEMISAFFPQQHHRTYSSTEELKMVMKEIEDARNALNIWERENLEATSISPEKHDSCDAIRNLINMIRAYYFTARIHLVHCETFVMESKESISTPKDYFQRKDSALDLKQAVIEVHRVMIYMGDAPNQDHVPLSILALMAWPLVVATIDVNLAKTNEENIRRTQQMDCLGKIYRHLTGVADVTSFVTAGAKQILLLANMAVQQILLRAQMKHFETSQSTVSQEIHDVGFTWLDNSLTGTGDKSNSLLSWLDIFIQFPRVYLLISKSTDYSLSCGRLPDQDKLPDCLQPGSILGTAGIQLPWLTKCASGTQDRLGMDYPREETYGMSSSLPTERFRSYGGNLASKPFESKFDHHQSGIRENDYRDEMTSDGLFDTAQIVEQAFASEFAAPRVPQSIDSECLNGPEYFANLGEGLGPREESSLELWRASVESVEGWTGYEDARIGDALFVPEFWPSHGVEFGCGA